MLSLQRILETALYVDDLARAAAFYEDAMALAPMFESPTLRAYDVGGVTVLLLFQRGASMKTQVMPGGTVPAHDGAGPIHIAFAVAADELAAWEARLAGNDIAIEGRTTWARGGTSLYFRDPDGHCSNSRRLVYGGPIEHRSPPGLLRRRRHVYAADRGERR